MSTQRECSDGERLKLKFAELKREKGINKAEFARLTKFPGGASMISQNVSGHKPISLAGAKCYASGFGCSIEEISPSLAATLPHEDGAAQMTEATADLLARYEQADASVQAEVDELTSLPPEEAIKLAAIIKSIRATYAPKT